MKPGREGKLGRFRPMTLRRWLKKETSELRKKGRSILFNSEPLDRVDEDERRNY